MYGDFCPRSDSSGSQCIFKNRKVNKSEDAILYPSPTGVYLISAQNDINKTKHDGAIINDGLIRILFLCLKVSASVISSTFSVRLCSFG